MAGVTERPGARRPPEREAFDLPFCVVFARHFPCSDFAGRLKIALRPGKAPDGSREVTQHMTQLLDQIVFLEVVDARHVAMDAARYMAAARSVRQIVKHELSGLKMRDFVTPILPTLQTTAENIFFDGHRRFADIDGRGDARRAQIMADALLSRLGAARRV